MCVLTTISHCADTDTVPLFYENMLFIMGSQCSLILILELWLYSIWFPRVWVISSITNWKCHPDSKIGCQAVYTFRNTSTHFSSPSLGNASPVATVHCMNTPWRPFRRKRLWDGGAQCMSPEKHAPFLEEPFQNFRQCQAAKYRRRVQQWKLQLDALVTGA